MSAFNSRTRRRKRSMASRTVSFSFGFGTSPSSSLAPIADRRFGDGRPQAMRQGHGAREGAAHACGLRARWARSHSAPHSWPSRKYRRPPKEAFGCHRATFWQGGCRRRTLDYFPSRWSMWRSFEPSSSPSATCSRAEEYRTQHAGERAEAEPTTRANAAAAGCAARR